MIKNKKFIFCFIILPILTFCQNYADDFYEENDKINLFAFIGEKISIEEFNPNSSIKVYDTISKDTVVKNKIVMDYAYKVKYKILKKVFNNLKTDTIEFVAYDHYGKLSFENDKYVLLYISRNEKEDGYFHQKYQYDVVYLNNDNVWYGIKDWGKASDVVSIEYLFNVKKKGIFKERKIFN